MVEAVGRLASFDDASTHLQTARAALSSLDRLGTDHAPCVAMLRGLVDDIEAMVRSRSTERRATVPG